MYVCIYIYIYIHVWSPASCACPPRSPRAPPPERPGPPGDVKTWLE